MMNSIKRYIKPVCWTMAATAVLFLGGCKKWVDVNYNPQQISGSNATPDLMLTDLLVSDGGGDLVLPYWMGYYNYPFTQVGDIGPTYNLTPARALALPGNVRNLRFMEQKAMALGQTFYAGIAKYLIATSFAATVDKFNNVPYKESSDPERYPYPKYEDGKFIYEEAMRILDTAMSLIKGADVSKNPRINITDVMFHADKGKWLRLSNTVKLRLLVHQANRADRAAYISDQIAKITAEGSGFLHAGEDASSNPGFSESKPNLFFLSAGFSQDGYEAFSRANYSANLIAMNFLKQNNDPRLGFFYTLPVLPLPMFAPEPVPQLAPQAYRGGVYGLEINQLTYPYQGLPYTSAIGGAKGWTPVTPQSSGVLKGYDQAAMVFSSVESMFLQAEAVYRGWIPGDKKQAYLNAVKESFRWLNVGLDSNNPSLSDAIFNTWYASETVKANGSVSWDHAPDKYKLIMFQKYLAMNGISPGETWTDYRRNGAYPVLPLSASPGRTRNSIPVRFPYPESEYKINAANVNAQGPIDIFTSKIWWMP